MIAERWEVRTRKCFVFVGTITLFQLLLLPTPGNMTDFMIGCTIGNFRPSSTCQAVCRLLQNRTACCYGVNYDSRAVCACCNLNSNGRCPTVCGVQCHIITLNAGNCSELRGVKSRTGGGGGGPSIINDFSILSDHPDGTAYSKSSLLSSSSAPRAEPVDEEEEEKVSLKSSLGNSSTKNKHSFGSTTNKLFSRLSSSLDLF